MSTMPDLPPGTPLGEKKSGEDDDEGRESHIIVSSSHSEGNLLSKFEPDPAGLLQGALEQINSQREELELDSSRFSLIVKEIGEIRRSLSQIRTKVEPDLYTEDRNMGVERGEEAPGVEPEIDQQEPLEVIPENTSRYEQAIKGLPLMGIRPEFIVIDQDDNSYLGRKDAAKMAKVSTRYMADLVTNEQVQSKTLNGHEKYIDLLSLTKFLLFERRPRGRPRKNQR